jgi:hypothetical protein
MNTTTTDTTGGNIVLWLITDLLWRLAPNGQHK